MYVVKGLLKDDAKFESIVASDYGVITPGPEGYAVPSPAARTS